MELVVEVYVNNSKVPAKSTEPVGKGLIKVADIIDVEKQDLKCINTYLTYFAKRYQNSKPIWVDIIKSFLAHDFVAISGYIKIIRNMVDAAKADINMNRQKSELMRNQENFDKAIQLFAKEIENIDLFHGAITSSIAKCKKFTLRKIIVVYKNSDAILDYYTNLINSLEKDTLEQNADGSYTAKTGSTSEKSGYGSGGLPVIQDTSALSSRSSFSSDL
ncbi:MAG: hypothetical protein RLZZ210_1789 [Pseudomonadota bacterium]